jgi:hypothetical protein
MPWREAQGTLVRQRRASRRELNSDGGGCAGAAAVSFGKEGNGYGGRGNFLNGMQPCMRRGSGRE